MPPDRILHITLPKCGSQWVRDVLLAPEIQQFHSYSCSHTEFDLARVAIPDVADGAVSSPVIGMDRWHWRAWRKPTDRAVVVVRDPRDRLVSAIYSYLYSHARTPRLEIQREILLMNNSMQVRIKHEIVHFRKFCNFYRSWAHQTNDADRIVRFEKLVAEQFATFSNLMVWLGWEVPDAVLEGVIDRLSFAKRSGRRLGDTDLLSHYRRGVAGDWRNHFERAHGELWETLYPDLLVELGYEADSTWWKSLPEKVAATENENQREEMSELHLLKRRNRVLETQAKEKEQMIREQQTLLSSFQRDHIRRDGESRSAENMDYVTSAIGGVTSEKDVNSIERTSETRDVLRQELVRKEKVIQMQAAQLRRSSFLSKFSGIGLLRRVVFVMLTFLNARLGENAPGPLIRRLIRSVTPKLGKLAHYSPRDLDIAEFKSVQGKCAQGVSKAENLPTVTLITPSLNQGRFIERTIRSVLDQEYHNLDYLVKDAVSADDTISVLETINDARFRWISEPDKGQSDGLNRGFADTSGEIMAWINADDMLLPGVLQRVGTFFLENPDIDVIYGNRILVDESDSEIGRWILPKHQDNILSWVDFIPQETLFWRRTLWDRSGTCIDDSFDFAMDWDLIVRFREAGAKFALIDEFLGLFRVHPAQKTSLSISDTGHAEMDRIRERCLGYVPSESQIRRAAAPYVIRHVVKDVMRRSTGYR